MVREATKGTAVTNDTVSEGGTRLSSETWNRLVVHAHSPLSGEDLRSWILSKPEVIEGTRRGFDEIRQGRFRRVSLPKDG